MLLKLQRKLLTVLEEGKIRRLGGDVEIQLNVRVIATTNRLIIEEIKAARFREDLYYRLAVITINIPLLRESETTSLSSAKAFRKVCPTGFTAVYPRNSLCN